MFAISSGITQASVSPILCSRIGPVLHKFGNDSKLDVCDSRQPESTMQPPERPGTIKAIRIHSTEEVVLQWASSACVADYGQVQGLTRDKVPRIICLHRRQKQRVLQQPLHVLSLQRNRYVDAMISPPDLLAGY